MSPLKGFANICDFVVRVIDSLFLILTEASAVS